MSQITVTLPDGSSSRAAQPAHPSATWRPRSRPGSRKAALARHRRRQAGRSRRIRSTRTRRSASSPTGARKRCRSIRHSTAHLLAAAVTNLFPGAQCGIGPATDEGFFYDFVVERPFVPEDLEAIEKKMQRARARRICLRAADVAARGSEGVLRAARRAAEGAADRGEDRRPDGGLLLHDQGQGDLHRLLRRPARAVDRQAEGVQAARARRTRTGRATRATSRCSASTARRSLATRI